MDITVNLTVNAAAPSTPISTSPVTSVVFDGVEFFFDRTVNVGFFAYPGEPFVLSDQAFEITSITPASGNLNGDGVIGNGAMQDPAIPSGDEGTREQGFDQRIAEFGSNPNEDVKETPYNSALNIDPANGGNISISFGQKTSIVKSVRNPAATSEGAVFQQIDRYITLTVLDQAPPVGTCRPSRSGSAKIIRGTQDVTFTSRGLTLPASWGVTVADIIGDISPYPATFHSNPENLRLMRTEPSAPTGYSGEFVEECARYVYAINTTAPTTQQRDDMIAQIITIANDIEGFQDTGFSLGAGAGQGGCIWLWAMAAAALTQDASLLSKVRGWNLQPDASPLWITSALIGVATPGKNGDSGQTYFTEQLGMPTVNPEYLGSSYHERYVDIGGFIVAWEVVAILAFAQGPAGFANGEAMIRNNGSVDSSNDLAAGLAWAAVARTFSPQDWAPGAYRFEAEYDDAWDDLVADGAVTPFTGQPSDPPRREYFTAAAGGITFNEPSGFDYETEGSRTYEVAYSLDRVQFAIETGVVDGQTVTGLVRGAEHLCKLRHRTASGPSAWNFYGNTDTPVDDDSSWVGLVTPTGTQTNAQADFTGGLFPQIHARLHPAYDLPQWEPIVGALNVNQVELAAGAGYPSVCHPAPTLGYQWKRNGANISGATSQIYTRVAADADATLTCDVSLTNSQGTTTETTAGVTAPSLTQPPTGTLIDTDFRGAFAVDYEPELNSIVGTNANIFHEPTESFPDTEAATNLGALHMDKTTASFTATMDLSRQVVPGTTYRIQAEFVSKRNVGMNSQDTIHLSLRRQSNGTPYDTTETVDITDAYGVRTMDFTVTIPGGESALDAEVYWGCPGGSSGGSTSEPWLSQLSIVAQ